jgi:membrane protein YqaA with SNARE-associated domain
MMRLFGSLYDKVMKWSTHPHAERYLAALSFAESSFFPIPPDVMLAPMSLASPARAWHYAALTTVASVLGGLLGYLIGHYAIDWVMPLIERAGYADNYQRVHIWFDEWGFWAVFIAGFSPIPYKLFTIAAGALSMAIAPFVIASTLSRGARFFIVAGLMMWGGARLQGVLQKYVDRIGWAMVGVLCIAYIAYRG